MTSFLFTVIVAIILFIITICLIKYLGNTGELIISICLAIAVAALAYGVYRSNGIMWAFGAILVPLLLCHVVWSYLKVNTSSTTTPYCWEEVIAQEVNTDSSFNEFETKFKNITNLSIEEFSWENKVEITVTDKEYIWNRNDIKLIQNISTRLYSLQKYISK